LAILEIIFIKISISLNEDYKWQYDKIIFKIKNDIKKYEKIVLDSQDVHILTMQKNNLTNKRILDIENIVPEESNESELTTNLIDKKNELKIQNLENMKCTTLNYDDSMMFNNHQINNSEPYQVSKKPKLIHNNMDNSLNNSTKSGITIQI